MATADLRGTIPRLHRVTDRRAETADTVTLTLGPVDPADPSAPPLAPRPGQFAMVSAFGCGEVPISYSAVGGADGSVEHTVRVAGAATAALVGLEVGAVVTSRGPYGTGWDLEAAAGRDVVVIAGGIGLAPLKGLIDTVLADRDRYGSVNVLIGARTPEDLCFTPERHAWCERGDVEVACTVDRLGDPRHPWPGAVGVVTGLLPNACFDPAGAAAFVCGPEVMMRATVRALVARGVGLPDVQISVERSMTCGVGLCGHCQLGPLLVCREGPVFPADRLLPLLEVRER